MINTQRFRDRELRKRKKVLRNKLFLINYLRTHPCVDCGCDELVVLEFDHVKPKKIKIGNLANNDASIERIKRELAKCEVRCANCHMRRHRTEVWNRVIDELLLDLDLDESLYARHPKDQETK